jgi:hypothetical protein
MAERKTGTAKTRSAYLVDEADGQERDGRGGGA